ncbi:MAG: ABC transporter ATP-binding protein [Clostridiales Family XIII bacterium]|jgi:branched-chain amino acid transport system ATP-binding protein|nr:ABC transporter ATP-binding protein [Clostridiales Family XIII bacterium]
MLSVKNLSIAYNGVKVVHGIDFKAEKGKVTVLIGANGAGKTSIIRSIMNLIKSESDEILYDGEDIKKTKPNNMSRIGISLCPEGRQLFPDMTVLENLEMGAYARKDKAGIATDLVDILDKFPRLKDRKTQCAGTLSGGEQELLAIARALMGKPKLLILDEPSWGVAPIMVEEVMKMTRHINEEMGVTVLLVEQNANVALRYSDYAYVLDVGEIAIQGTGEALLGDRKVQEIYLGI